VAWTDDHSHSEMFGYHESVSSAYSSGISTLDHEDFINGNMAPELSFLVPAIEDKPVSNSSYILR
jgi:hypothetical protein